MSKKILEVYKEYNIRPNLQDHMFRVAGVAFLICDNCVEPVLKEKIVLMCLLHDMGNILKSQPLEYYPEFVEPEGIEFWKNIKEEFKKKYGENENKATLAIVKEMKMSAEFITEFEKFILSDYAKYEITENVVIKICKYSDLRVSPFGVLSIEERINEWQKRNPKVTKQYAQSIIDTFLIVEKEIFQKCKIKPEDITDKTIEPIIQNLKNFVIE